MLVTSCGFTRYPRYYEGDLTGWTHKGYMPAIASKYDKDPAKLPFDFTEILGVIAPRTVFINAPVNDSNFDVTGVKESVASNFTDAQEHGKGASCIDARSASRFVGEGTA